MWNLDELRAFVIGERIEMLLQEQNKKNPKKSKEEIEILDKGESYLKSLDEETHYIMNKYIDQLFSNLAKDEAYLYIQGFCDGVKIVNGLNQLNKIE